MYINTHTYFEYTHAKNFFQKGKEQREKSGMQFEYVFLA